MTTDLLERAHAAAYRFPAGFAGFHATVHTSAGDTGTVVVRGRRDHEFVFTHEAGDADWAREQVASILGHRWPAPYAEGDGRYSSRTETDGDPGGTLVRLTGDPMNSAYRVRDDEISEVHRTTGQVRFTIVISGSTHTAEGRLPNHFSVYYWRGTTAGCSRPTSTATRTRRSPASGCRPAESSPPPTTGSPPGCWSCATTGCRHHEAVVSCRVVSKDHTGAPLARAGHAAA